MNPVSRIFASIRMRLLKRKFASGNYLDAYAESTNIKAQIDPEMAIGGLWEDMGRHQFEFLKKHGLEPQHRLLDIGCGSLRGGLLFIEYLDKGHYTGFDLSSEVIEAGNRKVREQGLADKSPQLLVNHKKNLKFDFLEGATFDFLLAQSVFSHLQPDHIRECFDNLEKVMAPGARFLFTHHPGERYRQRSQTDFEYPRSFFEEVADSRGFDIADLSEGYQHPRAQNMLMVYRKAQG